VKRFIEDHYLNIVNKVLTRVNCHLSPSEWQALPIKD
jgi:hypothetical protein